MTHDLLISSTGHKNAPLLSLMTAPTHGRHDVECVVLRIGNKNGAPLVEVTCFLVEVTLFFLRSDLQMTEP